MRADFKSFCIELAEEDYAKLETLVKSGKYRTKVAAIRDLLRRAE